MKSLLLSLVTLTVLVSCNGGNGSGAVVTNPDGTTDNLSHNELAEQFVNNLNLSPDFSVSLVKDSTRQFDFIVIYDSTYGTYDAINISSYNPTSGVSAAEYYNNNSARFHYDLIKRPGHYEYRDVWVPETYDYLCDCYVGGYYALESYWVPTRYYDPATGLLFEKTQASAKDLAKMVALQEVAQIAKSAEFLSSEFGLSLDRSKELATLQAHWKKASLKSMTASEVDAFSTELLGFSLTDGIAAVKADAEGNSSSLESLVKRSSELNGVTPEHANKLMTQVFGL